MSNTLNKSSSESLLKSKMIIKSNKNVSEMICKIFSIHFVKSATTRNNNNAKEHVSEDENDRCCDAKK